MFKNIFIGLISVNQQTASKTQKRISHYLKIPLQDIRIFMFPIEKDKSQKNKAISISHQKIVNEAKKQNYTMTMIFEDDVDFYNDQQNHVILEHSLNQIKSIPNWDVLFLGCFNPFYYSNVNKNLEKVTYGLGTHAYILSESGMDKVSKINFENIRNIPILDVSFNQIDFGVTGLMNGYQMKPMIAYQNKTPRIIHFINSFYNTKGGFQRILHKYIRIFWFLVIIIIIVFLILIIKMYV